MDNNNNNENTNNSLVFVNKNDEKLTSFEVVDEKQKLTSLELIDEKNVLYNALWELKSLNENLNEIRSEQFCYFSSIKNDTLELKERLLKKDKEKKRVLPCRDDLTRDLFYELVYRPKARFEQQLAYSRFRIIALIDS